MGRRGVVTGPGPGSGPGARYGLGAKTGAGTGAGARVEGIAVTDGALTPSSRRSETPPAPSQAGANRGYPAVSPEAKKILSPSHVSPSDSSGCWTEDSSKRRICGKARGGEATSVPIQSASNPSSPWSGRKGEEGVAGGRGTHPSPWTSRKVEEGMKGGRSRSSSRPVTRWVTYRNKTKWIPGYMYISLIWRKKTLALALALAESKPSSWNA